MTHKIRKLTTDANGEPGFVTFGTTTNTDDEIVVTYAYVLGKYQTSIPKVGTFFRFLKTTPGYIVCILVPFLLLIVLEGVRCIRLFKKYKAEQNAELAHEREEVEAQRLENQRMMQQLLAMQAQMANGGEKGQDAPQQTVQETVPTVLQQTAPANLQETAPAAPQQTLPTPPQEPPTTPNTPAV